MALSSSGAIKAFLEGNQSWKPEDVGVPVYRDRVPEGQAFPYMTVNEGLNITPRRSGDDGYKANAMEMCQVSVWQQWVDRSTNKSVERITLGDDVASVLNGGRLTTLNKIVYGMKVNSVVRIPDDDNNIIQTAITVHIERKL